MRLAVLAGFLGVTVALRLSADEIPRTPPRNAAGGGGASTNPSTPPHSGTTPRPPLAPPRRPGTRIPSVYEDSIIRGIVDPVDSETSPSSSRSVLNGDDDINNNPRP